MPGMRVGENPFNNSVYFVQENYSQPIFLFLVVKSRLSQLRKRRERESVVVISSETNEDLGGQWVHRHRLIHRVRRRQFDLLIQQPIWLQFL